MMDRKLKSSQQLEECQNRHPAGLHESMHGLSRHPVVRETTVDFFFPILFHLGWVKPFP